MQRNKETYPISIKNTGQSALNLDAIHFPCNQEKRKKTVGMIRAKSKENGSGNQEIFSMEAFWNRAFHLIS